MEFVLSNAIIRPWIASDGLALLKHANNKQIADNMRDGFPFPYTLEDAHTWLNMAMKEKRHILKVTMDPRLLF